MSMTSSMSMTYTNPSPSGRAQRRARERDVQQLVRRPLAEHVRVQGVDEGRVLLGPVRVAGGRVRQHPQSHAVRVGQLGKPLGERIVERQTPSVLELQQEVD